MQHSGKIYRVNRKASAFELIYNRSPLIAGKIECSRNAISTMRQHAAHVGRRRIYMMLISNERDLYIPKFGK